LFFHDVFRINRFSDNGLNVSFHSVVISTRLSAAWIKISQVFLKNF
jgi:hypothetical protein